MLYWTFHDEFMVGLILLTQRSA